MENNKNEFKFYIALAIAVLVLAGVYLYLRNNVHVFMNMSPGETMPGMEVK